MIQRDRFKVVLLGDKMTGKTCLSKRFCSGEFSEYERSTIIAAYDSKTFTIEGKEYQMEIWDTTGEERYRSISSLYYRNAAAAILCYDVTHQETFYKINFWLKELLKVHETCRLYLCATKSDLLQQFEANPRLTFVESYAHEHGAKFFLTSSRTGENVEILFNEILNDHIADLWYTSRISDTIKLSSKQLPLRKRKCCSR